MDFIKEYIEAKKNHVYEIIDNSKTKDFSFFKKDDIEDLRGWERYGPSNTKYVFFINKNPSSLFNTLVRFEKIEDDLYELDIDFSKRLNKNNRGFTSIDELLKKQIIMDLLSNKSKENVL